MEARNRNVEDWFASIRQGHAVLPRFQRFEAWGWWQIEGILENILRAPALPVGALLVLQVGDTPPFIARPISGAPETEARPNEHVLDGQQRLTALWRSLNGLYDDFSYMVSVDDLDIPDVKAWRRYDNKGGRYPLWCDDPAETWDRKWVPVSLLAPDALGAERAKAWIKLACQGDMDQYEQINDVVNEFRARVSKYSLPFLSLPRETARDAALDVFIKMNTQNTALSAFDIVVAQVEAAMETSLHDKVDALLERVPAVGHFGQAGELAMQVGAVLEGRPPNRATFLSDGFGERLAAVWDDVEVGLRRATEFLAEEKIFDAGLLPSDPLLITLAGFWARAPHGRDAEGAARKIARRALWTGAFSDRYQKTSATRTAVDVKQLTALLVDPNCIPELFDAERTALPNEAELVTGGWPKTKDRLGRAIMAAALRAGGHDFADDTPFGPNQRSNREYHHLFPKALLENDGIAKRRVFCALNCALVSWQTNRTIGAKPPSEYIAERSAEFGLSTGQVDARLTSHVIPPAALRGDDFEAFLAARASMVHTVMQKLCAGEAVTPSGLN